METPGRIAKYKRGRAAKLVENRTSTPGRQTMPLSSQDKLALALTSAGSMRNLAKLVGVTHQKIGRWLREGQPDGAKKIPDEATAAINVAFAFHKDITKQQAKVDRIPYDPKAPVFFERPTLRNGKPGERLAAENTQYIKRELRDQIFTALHQTAQVININVRSVINLKSYLGAKPTTSATALESKFKDASEKDEIGRKTLFGAFKDREDKKAGSGFEAPVYTPSTQFGRDPRTGRFVNVNESLKNINSRLQERHSPHATVFADQFLIQTLPGQYDNQAKPKRQSAKRTKLIRR